MHAVSRDHLLPTSYRVSTPSPSGWRHPRSNVSSPGFSDSKDEEDMDIDPDENSPPTDFILHNSSISLLRSRSLSLFSLSDLHISESQSKPETSRQKPPMSSKHSQSPRLKSSEKTSDFSSPSTCYAKQPLRDRSLELDESDHLSSDVTCVSGTGAALKEQLALVPWNDGNNDSQTRDTLKTAGLPKGHHKLLFGAKCCVLFVAILMTAIAIFVSCVLQSPATQCVDHIDVNSLCRELQQRVHGQHIAVNVVIKRLEEFLSASSRQQLVMSFHGWTGIGKNFMSSIIAQYLPLTNVHKFIVPLHFAHGTHSEALSLSNWIVSNMSSPACGLQLFIIDEIDKTPGSVVHALRETLNRLSIQSNICCRAVFLLLTNDGATEINAAVTEALMIGAVRQELELEDLLPRFGSEFYSELMSAKLIDQVVPFLPLERRHVAQCTEAELRLRGVDITPQLVDNVLNSLSYFPSDVSLFSSSGCRRIAHLVDLYL